jgi:hypothetical protein
VTFLGLEKFVEKMLDRKILRLKNIIDKKNLDRKI